MTANASYRDLRHFLLLRLGIGAVILTLIGAVGVNAVRDLDAPEADRTTSPPVASRQSAPTLPARPVSSVVTFPAPRSVLDQPQIAEAMRTISALEPLEGKTLEVLAGPDGGQRSTAAQDESDTQKKGNAARAKLPKGPHLQAGIFAQPANAEEFRRKLEAEGYPAYVETRVHVGPFPGRKEAERVREKLKAQGTTTVFIAQ